MPTISNVSAATPGVSGAVYRAPLGTTLPTNAVSSLGGAFVELGYVSEDGIVNANTPETKDIKDMGGTNVLNVLTERADTWQFTLIEVLNEDVLSAIYGADNVSGTLETGISVTANNAEMEEAVWVFDMIMRNGVLKRVVIPNGKIKDIGDITYKRDEAVGYKITITGLADTSNNTHYEYLEESQS